MTAGEENKVQDRKVAVVTGAGQGLGQATAIALAATGMDIALVGRTRAKLEATAAMVSGRTEIVVADLVDGDQVAAAFQQVMESMGRVDVLINNAAIYNPFRLDSASNDQIESMIANSFTAPVFCMREAINCIRAGRRGGDIVNVTSQSIQMPQPYMAVYSAAKAAVDTMSRGLRTELRGEPFRITNFSVGVIESENSHKIWTSREFMEEVTGAFVKSGVAPFFTSPGSSPESLANTIVHIVTAAADICLEQVDARGSHPTG